MSDSISKASVCEILADMYPTDGERVIPVKEIDKAYEAIQQLSPVQPEKRYTKADYIMALHKEYGCDFARAEKAHDKALEYLRDTAIIKG